MHFIHLPVVVSVVVSGVVGVVLGVVIVVSALVAMVSGVLRKLPGPSLEVTDHNNCSVRTYMGIL